MTLAALVVAGFPCQSLCTYQGSTAGRVYVDTLYRTYLFTLDYS